MAETALVLTPYVVSPLMWQNMSTHLMRAAFAGNRELAELLLARGAKVEARNKLGATALMIASMRGDVQMVALLLEKGKADPCCFYYRQRDLRVVVHGDDFTGLGADEDCEWLAKELRKHFELKVSGKLGPEETDDKQV